MKSLLDQSIEKSRSGIYQDTSENRRLHRVGQKYGEEKKAEEGEEKKSKREQRMERLLSYKQNLHTIEEALKRGMVSEDKKEKAEALKASLEEKISKLEAKLGTSVKETESKKEDLEVLKEKVSAAEKKWYELYKKSPYGSVRAQEAFMKYEKLKKQLEDALGKKVEEKEEPKKEEAKKPEKKQVMGPVTYGKDGVLVEEMAEGKKPEFVKHGKIDPPSDPDWQKKAESIDWDKIDLADMGQTIEYLGKIGQFEDGSDMYGIRYYSPNGKKSSVMALGKSDYLRDVKNAGFDVKEAMPSAVDYIDPNATETVKEIAKMILERRPAEEIGDYITSKHGNREDAYDYYYKKGSMEAEAAQIRMENAVNGIVAPSYEVDNSDPIPDSVKALNSRSDEETINVEIAKYLGLEPDPTSYYGVKTEDVGSIRDFWGRNGFRAKGLSKTAVIAKLKDGYKKRLGEKNRQAEEASMTSYYESPEGKARIAAYEEKRREIVDEAKSASKNSADSIKATLDKTGFEIKKVDVFSDGQARIYLEGGGQYGSDVDVYYRSRFGQKEREYEVDARGFGSVKPGTIEAKVVGLVGKMLTDESVIESIKGALEKTVNADSVLERKIAMLDTEFEDLMLSSEKNSSWGRGRFLDNYLKKKGE